VSAPDLKCPLCGTEEDEDFVGSEIRGVYDGVLFWICKKCDYAFPRDHGVPYRNVKSNIWADKYNKERRSK